jgi:hypothetical protein
MKRTMMVLLLAAAVAGTVLFAAVGGASGSPATANVAARPATPAGARALGAVPASSTQTGAVVLRPRNDAALTSFIATVTNRQSRLFHQYLAPGQFRGRFGPTQATVNAVTSQLRSEGLRVTSVAPDGLMIDFSGTAAAVERAFGTSLQRVRLADGSVAQQTTTALRLPASIASQVTIVVGLDDLVREHSEAVIHGSASGRAARPDAATPHFTHPAGSPNACSDAREDAETNGGLTDDQIGNAYGAFGLYGAGDTGSAQHVGIFELEPFSAANVKTFDSCYFGSANQPAMASRLSVVPVDGGLPAGEGSGEAILDVEDVSAMAPGANIDVYEAPNTNFGALDVYRAMVDADVDKVISTSWGICEQALQQGAPGQQQAENWIFQQAAAQGQTVFDAAGDEGSDDCDSVEDPSPVPGQNPVSVDDPTSQPYVVSAGGTTIDDATQPAAERVWNDGAAWGASGGGISMSWTMPSWQLDSRVPGITLPGSSAYKQANTIEQQYGYPQNFCQSYLAGATSSTPCRTVPDVASQADEFTGAVTIYSTEYGGWTTIGGTSSSAPLWAGMLALVNSSATCAANPATQSGVGFASPLLYSVASDPVAYKASFNDITSGNTDIFGLDNGKLFPASTGYDITTGLGSPQLTGPGGTPGLAYYLCSYGASVSRPVVTGLSPAVLPLAGGSVRISGSGFEPKSGAAVTAITVGDRQIPTSAITVAGDKTLRATFPPAAETLPPSAPKPQDGSGPALVTVSMSDGTSSTAGAASTIEYVDGRNSAPMPSITGLSPTGGSETAPKPITILGSGFTGATKVTFGGVPAASFHVLSANEISATPPVYFGGVSCRASIGGQSPASDICQTQVQVTGLGGASRPGNILRPVEGALDFSSPLGMLLPPPGCDCEVAPAPTEYDYAPAPTVTSVSTSLAPPGTLASEFGGTVLTVKGTGFNWLTLDWFDFGDPAQFTSVLNDIQLYETGTELQIDVPSEDITTEAQKLPFVVRSLAGQSAPAAVIYAGIPEVTSVVDTATGSDGAADTGGEPLKIGGHGFNDTTGPLQFADISGPYGPVFSTQYSYKVSSDETITTQSVGATPGLDDVEACTVTDCSYNPPDDYLYLYPPGNPKVSSVTPASGPAAGGTSVEIHGSNLGCVTGVFFGGVAATQVSNSQALLDCGSTDLIDATSPPGAVGSKAKVTVTTVESDFTGSGASTSSATFTYTK